MRVILASADPRLSSGSPYWPIHTHAPAPRPPLDGAAECDVAIIGGGITGSLIAYQMVAAGLNTVLVDKGRFGSGSTGASTALISYEFDSMLTTLIDQVGERSAIRAYELSREATSRLKRLVHDLEDPCDYDDKSSMRITNRKADFDAFEREMRMRNRHGLTVRLLGEKELAAEFGVTAALAMVSDTASQIDPLKLTYRLIRRAVQNGLRAYEDTRITRIEADSKSVNLGSSGGSMIRAKYVVFATGYESERYLSAKSERTTDYCFVSHPLKSLGKLGKCHFVENADDYLYLSTFGNRIMVGQEGRTFHSPAVRARSMERRSREILEKIGLYLPDLKLSVDYHWAGTFTNSPDSLPYLGITKDLPRTFFALGYGGNGIASSAVLAPILVDLVQGKKNADARIFRLER